MPDFACVLDRINFRIPGRRWQLYEICDFSIVPPFIKHDEQDALTARWTKTIPLLQTSSIAELAADSVSEALHNCPELNDGTWTVVDFGSGRGGPTPLIELLVNHGRREASKKSIAFQLSDLHPQLDPWIDHASQSDNLSFIPQPVDAANPPFAVISTTTSGDKGKAAEQGYSSNGSKVFRLFCETFHQFDDPTAIKVIQSTMMTSDAFAIIDLRERHVLSLVEVLLETVVTMICAIAWFWTDNLHLVLTYMIPLLPLLQYLSGIIGCLRRRTFEETLELFELASDKTRSQVRSQNSQGFLVGDWQFTYTRTRHTWPIGYMSVITGYKNVQKQT